MWRNDLDTGIASEQVFFGDPGDRHVVGNWGVIDQVDTPGVFRPGRSAFFLQHTLEEGRADEAFAFGEPSWSPLSGAFGLG